MAVVRSKYVLFVCLLFKCNQSLYLGRHERLLIQDDLLHQVQALSAKYGILSNQMSQLQAEVNGSRRAEGAVVVAEIQQSNQLTLAKGERMVFDNAITNIGKAYNTNLGYFEAPVNGTYLFSVTICMVSSNHASFSIMKGSQEIERFFVGNHDWNICGSGTTATYMSASEKIWVNIDNVYNGRTWRDANAKSSFTGVLLNTYTKL